MNRRMLRAQRMCPWGRPACTVVWGLGVRDPRLPDYVVYFSFATSIKFLSGSLK